MHGRYAGDDFGNDRGHDLRFGLNDGVRGLDAHRVNRAILCRALVGGAFWLRGAVLLGGTLLIGAVLARLVGTGVILARLVIAAPLGAVLLDARRIGAALAIVAGILAAIIVVALVVIALVIVALTITAVGVVARIVKALPVIALAIATLIILLAAVILIARRALVLAALLTLLTRARFGGFDQACFFIADHFDHIMAGNIRLLVATIIAVIGAVFALAPLARLTILRPVLRAVLRIALLAAFLFGGKLAVGFGQKPCVMFGMLQKVFSGNAVVGQLRITGEKLVFFDQLGRGATHLAIGARTVKNAVDDVTERARAVRFRTRTGLGRAHVVL